MEFKNKVEISGRAYRPQVRTTKSGKAITIFGLSVYNGKDQQTGKGTYCFMDCKLFGDGSSLSGDIVIQGRLAFDVWEKDGKKHTKPIIIVDKYELSEGQDPINDSDIPF